MWCDLKAVKLLHAGGADLEIANKRGKTALLLALQYGQVGIMGVLVKSGENVNVLLPAGIEWYITDLQGLVRYSLERLVRLALEDAVDPEVRDNEHQRAMDITFEQRLAGIVNILWEVCSSLPLVMDVESDLEMVWSKGFERLEWNKCMEPIAIDLCLVKLLDV